MLQSNGVMSVELTTHYFGYLSGIGTSYEASTVCLDSGCSLPNVLVVVTVDGTL